ncbi:MAG TPA: alpha/beta hydrolase [Methanomassiliicoccales archaeon]
MKIEMTVLEGTDLKIPVIRIIPKSPVGAAVVVHGYGGCKEEQLGLASRVAGSGLVTYAIDLRGHGQHPMAMDYHVQEDVELAIGAAREFGRVVAIGHSLGGRLSLMSSADFSIGISPPLDGSYGARTEELLKKLRGYRVRTDNPRKVFDILARIPEWEDKDKSRSMIIYGSRDVPEIVTSCDLLRTNRPNVIRIEDALHSDTYLLEKTFESIREKLDEWFVQ